MAQLLLAEYCPSVVAEDLVRLDAVAVRKSFVILGWVAEPPFSVLIHVDAAHYPLLLIGASDNVACAIDVIDSTIPLSFACPKCKKSKNSLYLYKIWACQTCHHLTKMESAYERILIEIKKHILSVFPGFKSNP